MTEAVSPPIGNVSVRITDAGKFLRVASVESAPLLSLEYQDDQEWGSVVSMRYLLVSKGERSDD